MKNTLAVFENFKIRRIYDEKSETWFFSVVDIIQVLTDTATRLSESPKVIGIN